MAEEKNTEQEVRELVKKYFPIRNPESSPLFEKVVQVCFHAGYYEMDIDELCYSLSNEIDNAYNRGLNTPL